MTKPRPHRTSPFLLFGLLAALSWAGGCSNARAVQGWNEYGNARPTADSVALTGRIEDVCMVKGCWMKVQEDDGSEVLVRFRDYGFFVPMNARGRLVVAEGQRQVRTFNQEQRRHLASDAGATDAEIEAITGSTTETIFIADGTWIQGGGLDAPYAPPVAEECVLDEPPTDETTGPETSTETGDR
ncbi:MAG: hypothetical protein CMJ51_03365 [Planctomycetaceae bacterium]|nr:hypothetical protein [Planctomycetaceae bacterium]